MAPPDPVGLRLPAQRENRRGLRIVHEDEVVLLFKRLGIRLGVFEVRRLVFSRQLTVRSLQTVVDRLGDIEKPLVTADNRPVGHQTEIGHERHDRPQQLRYATAIRRGVHMEHPRPTQCVRCATQLLELVGRSHAFIRVNRS